MSIHHQSISTYPYLSIIFLSISTHPSISVYPFIHLYLCIHPSIYIYLSIHMYLSIYPPIHPHLFILLDALMGMQDNSPRLYHIIALVHNFISSNTELSFCSPEAYHVCLEWTFHLSTLPANTPTHQPSKGQYLLGGSLNSQVRWTTSADPFSALPV